MAGRGPKKVASAPGSRDTPPRNVMKPFFGVLSALILALWANVALGQARLDLIEIKPVPGNATQQTVSLRISDAAKGSVLDIQGSSDLREWSALGQATADEEPVDWEHNLPVAAAPYFFRVKVNAPGNVLADGLYAKITTSLGTMTARLEYEKVPIIVANFVGLAEGTKFYNKDNTKEPVDPEGKPYYDGLIFHRVIKDFMIQGGCPLGNGTGNPSYWLPDQFHPDLKHDGPGVLSMANSGEHTNGSQFFITHAATPWLDFSDTRAGNHSVFGKVVEGLDVIDKIAGVRTGEANKPVEEVRIERIEIIRQGEKAKAFKATEEAIDQMLRDNAARQMAEIQNELKIEPTDSGLIYEELKAGEGEPIKATDIVTFHFIAELVTEVGAFGRIFADSVNPRPAPLRLAVSELGKVLPGVAEGVNLMKKDGHAVLYMPPELAYGKGGHYNARVPAHSVVIMEILIKNVEPGD